MRNTMRRYTRQERRLAVGCAGIGTVWGICSYLVWRAWGVVDPLTVDPGNMLRAVLLWPTYVAMQIHLAVSRVPIHYPEGEARIAVLAVACGLTLGLLWGLYLVSYRRAWHERSRPNG